MSAIRVVYLPLNFGSVVQSGVYDAFRATGCELHVFDYFHELNTIRSQHRVRERLLHKCQEVKPHLLHMQIQHTNIIDAGTIRKIKQQNGDIIITNWTGDVRDFVPATFKAMAMVSDYNLISSTGQLDMFRRECGPRVQYWQIGFDPAMHYPSKEKRDNFDFDAIFIGNHGYKDRYPGAPQREQVCSMMRDRFGDRFALFGSSWRPYLKPGPSLSQDAVCSYYHRSLCALSVNHFNDIQHYFSDRLLMCMASGRPTISFRFPGWESFFTDGADLLIANTLEEIPEKVKYLMNNRDHAEFIGEQGAAKVMAEHTYLSRINELLKMTGLR